MTHDVAIARIIGSVGVMLALLCAASAAALTWWILVEGPTDPGGGFIDVDARGMLLVMVEYACFFAALIATAGKGARAALGWGAFGFCVLMPVLLHHAH